MAWHGRLAKGLLFLGLFLSSALAQAAIALTDKISDVRGTKHNLSAAADNSATPSGGKVPVRTVKASSETQVCVFCHTPHAATTGGTVAPLWNRQLSADTYTTKYSSSSMEADAAELAAAPGGSSKLCLSCHDGTMAIDKVNVLNGVGNFNIPMTSASPVKMPAASASTGFTRDLGVNLSNDHPISFTYSSTLAGYDGELRGPDGATVGNRVAGSITKPKMPLESNQIQCATCHDPHLRDKTTSNGNAKFLRMNRFQVTQPTGGAFSTTNDIICLACHDKGGVSWAYSAHSNSAVATQTYVATAAQLREFPSSLDSPANTNPPVWQVACLNCHDTHTVEGARRLLREGTDSAATPKSGGGAALEETCYQCHTTSAASAVTYTALTSNAIPDIKTDFTTTGNKHMPIKSTEQAALTEVHDIGGVFNDGTNANCSKTIGNCGKDLLESRLNLGSGSLTNRHAECSDCHNPHRVIKYKDGLPGALSSLTFNNSGLSASGTHKHTDDATDIHTNNISGVLRGSWGVEPSYNSNSFQITPSTGITFAVKRGDPGINTAPATGSRPGAETYLTREYQICLKCHSNYAYPDDNVHPSSANRPQLGGTGLTSTTRTNDGRAHTSYTNQAKEFQAPSTHAVANGSVNLGIDGGTGPYVSATNNPRDNNNRSWHPVMAPTGRTGRAGAWIRPWNNSGTGGKAGRLGVQTMYCSDCHGSDTGATTGSPPLGTVIPVNGENGSPWGPHGSANDFILKGQWNETSGEGSSNTLCFKCHSQSAYSGGGGTGFSTDRGDGHSVHSDRIDYDMKCNFCHVAVPHGWKNRSLLVNLLDVGPEVGLTAGTAVSYTNNVGYTNGPYYRKAYLRIRSFPAAGNQWTESNCNGGSKDTMKTNCEKPT
jgi:hypothetical protein